MDSELNPKAIGAYLRQLRGAKTQEEVANAIGVTSMAISSYENGERIPRDEIKIRIANYYDRTVQQVFFTPR